MAKIRESQGRVDENSGYTRLMGNPQVGHLLSRMHAAVIRSGTELERILASNTQHQIASLENVLAAPITQRVGIQVVFDSLLKFEVGSAIKADILLIDHSNKLAKIIELKDGDTFDTKKASGELQSLRRFAAEIEDRMGYATSFYLCSFNQSNKLAIAKGAKREFSIDEVMTGRELCELLGINFESVVEYRILEQQENLSYFLDQLLAIDEVREGLVARLQMAKDEDR